MGKDPRVARATAEAKKKAQAEGQSFQDKRILKKRQYNMATNEHDARVTSVENVRREEIEGKAGGVLQVAGPGGGRRPGGRPDDPPPPPPPAIIIDRFHKWGRCYVTVSKDHFPGDDPIPNPGYAPTNAASTIEAALDKARELVAKMTEYSFERCTVVIFGGVYEEDISLDTRRERIDLVGIGNPIIYGNFLLGSTAEILFEGITFESPNELPAMFMISAFSWRRGNPHLSYGPSVKFRSCHFFATHTALKCMRTALFENCYFEQTQNQSVIDEIATVYVGIDRNMYAPVKFQGCRIFCYSIGEWPTTSHRYENYAIKVTAKTGHPLVDGGYQQVENTSVVLDDCYVYGSALVEGWRLIHRGGAVHHGVPAPDLHTYGVVRGWVIHTEMEGAVGEIPGYIDFDHTGIYSTMAAIFRRDDDQAHPHVWGGTASAFNCVHYGVHYSPFGTVNFADQMFMNVNAVGHVIAYGNVTAASHIYSGGLTHSSNITNVDPSHVHNHYLKNY